MAQNQTNETGTAASFRNRKYIQSPPKQVDYEAIRQLVSTNPYQLDGVLAKGAESVLYDAHCGTETFCVKCVRNFLNGWIGDAMTRDQQPLLKGVSYRTKRRHILNEFAVSKALFQKKATPALHIYALRKVRRFGLEVGYDLVMERLSGHNLSDKVFLETFTLADKLEVMVQMAQALDYIHKRHYVHLDVKPSNFMLHNGRVKIIDFGVSVPSGYQPHAVTGTAGFLSPEQICKERVSPLADIFALGISYAVIFGGRPLQQSAKELKTRSYRDEARRQLREDIVPVAGDMVQLTDYPDLEEILRRCTTPKREQRIPSCGALLRQISIWAKDNGITLDSLKTEEK